jgi:hypothetical protein
MAFVQDKRIMELRARVSSPAPSNPAESREKTVSRATNSKKGASQELMF